MTDTRGVREIVITTIPHARQRYPTTGDWTIDEPHQRLLVTVSAMGDWRYEMLVGVHEVVEALLCVKRGVNPKAVDSFDVLYEDARDHGGEAPCGCTPTDDSEPGDDEHAPYYVEHQLATSVERMLAAQLGVSWNRYEQANLDLYAPQPAAPAVKESP